MNHRDERRPLPEFGPVGHRDTHVASLIVRKEKVVEKTGKRIGVFGGSFDPVHWGHLLIAETARESLGLDHIRWIPASTSPLKRDGPVASDADRLAMLRLAIDDADGHVIDPCELERGEVSYTVDTLDDLRLRFPGAELFLIIGSDSLATWPRWHAPERIAELATVAVVRRGGEPPIDFSPMEGFATPERIDAAREHVIPMPTIELSSTELRTRLAGGRPIRFRTPPAVQRYIETGRLYQGDA